METKDLRRINYEGDDLSLTKEQIITICDQVAAHWAKDRFKNARRLLSLSLFKTGIVLTGRKDVEDIWKIMLKFIDELRYQNYIQSKGIGSNILKQVKHSIAKEIFD